MSRLTASLTATLLLAALAQSALPASAQTPATPKSDAVQSAPLPPPVPGPSSSPAPGAAPGAAIAPTPAPDKPKDIFAEPVTLTEKIVVYAKGQANWGDTAFEALVAKFRLLNEYLDKQKIVPTGPALTVYTQTDDTGFSFQAELPIAAEPKEPPPGDLAIGRSPSGKTLKFVHRGAFDTLDSTYEAITNYLDEKNLEARDLFIEEYTSDPVKASEDNLVVNIYVPLK